MQRQKSPRNARKRAKTEQEDNNTMKALHNAIIAYILIVNACKVCNAIISAAVATLSPCHNQNCAFKAVLRRFNCLRWSYTANTLKTPYRRNTCKLRLSFDGIQIRPKQTAGRLALVSTHINRVLILHHFTRLKQK